MSILRLANGSDTVVKLSIEETLERLKAHAGDPDFVELPGEEGPLYIRPSGVIALFADGRRGTAGFRVGISGSAG